MKDVRNQVQIIGRLGTDVEFRTIQNDRKVANIRVAVNRYYTNSIGQKVENTDWFKVVAWGHLAEHMMNILHKGDEIMVQGRLSTGSYEDKNNVTHYTTDIVADQFLFISSPKKVQEDLNAAS